MDNNNVIIPTNNLEELEKDMAEWNKLPYKLKKLSIDDCMRKYNCTIYDLYNRLKGHILDMQAREDQEPNNLVVINTESADEEVFYDYSSFGEYEDFENYHHLIQLADILMNTDSNIIIITPNDNTMEVLEDKYERYNHLIQKFKTFSNDYSIQLWGYNVPNMYEKMKSKINTSNSDLDDNNILNYMEESSIIDNNIKIHEDAKCINANNKISIPKIVPWFTVDEMDHMGIKFTHTDPTSYYKAIKEAKSEEELLNLGWNPSVEINEKGFEIANQRQKRYFDTHLSETIDLRDHNSIKSHYYPVYILIENPIPDSDALTSNAEEFANAKHHYSKYGICIDNKLYVPNEDDVFTISDINNEFHYFEIVVYFFTEEIYNDILQNINGYQSNIPGSSNLYMYLFNRSTPLDRTKETLIYNYIFDQLLSIAGIDDYRYIIRKFYRIFKGYIENFDFDKVNNIIRVIHNNI
ncbi:MAG: hypothetical protein IKR19_08205 [Acholeplasmatales bacterium]|nr:hypothetical protein [Acholeplasmatales bacterium]